MLKEGKERIFSFIVWWLENDKRCTEYFYTSSAQNAVNLARNKNPNITVVEVAKVVNNWK